MSTRTITLDLHVSPASEAAFAAAWYLRGTVDTPTVVYTASSGIVTLTGAPLSDVLTYTDSAGQRRRWPSGREPVASQTVILALPATGLTAADVALSLFHDGVAQATPVMVELSLGDYAVTIPALSAGAWTVTARFGGQAFSIEQVESAVVATSAASLLPDLADCFPDTLFSQPVSLDEEGEFAASGSEISAACYISEKSRLVRDPSTGREVVSSFKITVAATDDLTVESHRYTLPVRFNPRESLTAISVKKVSDENGPHHEVVMLP